MKTSTLAQRLKAADDHRDQRVKTAILRDLARTGRDDRAERPEVKVRANERSRSHR